MDLISKVITACTVWMGIAIAAPAIWDGTADVSWYESSAQAYNLTTAEQLAGLAKLVNQGTSSFEGKTITLGADIFLNDTAGADAGTWASVPHTEWTPIGTSSRPFKGEFDGIAGKKNRKIYGLYVSDTSKSHVGLFGYTSDVKISNLDVLVGRITAKDNVGALVGYAMGGSITNVHGEVRVIGNNHVGGLVGYFTGSLSTSSVKENVAGQDSVGGLIGITTGSVSGTAKSNSSFVGSVTGRNYVGGLVGAGSSISKSYAEGIVKGSSSYVGGVAGNVTGNIDSTYHIGGDVSGAGYVGGLIGLASSSVKNSYSEGNVTGTSSYVGGLVGDGSSVASSNHTKGDVSGAGYVGGLIGRASSTVTNSYSEGNVTGQGNYVGGLIGVSYYYYSGSSDITIMTAQNSYATGNVKGKGYVGGLIGLDSIYRYSSNTKTLIKKISNSHSVGNVIGKDKYVGGVIGKSNYGYQSFSYSTPIFLQILSSYHKGSVESDSSYVGGVAGYASGNIDSTYHVDGNVNGFGYVGGLAGYATSSVKNSYSEGDATGQGNCVGGLIGLSYYYYMGSSDITIMTAQNSYAIGNVKGKGYVGGLIGLDSIYRYSNNTNTLVKKISNSHSVGNVVGKDVYVGGVLGKSNYGYRSSSYSKNISLQILSSYHKGSVDGSSSYVGGVAGYAIGGVDSTYHIDGGVKGKGYVGGLIGWVSSSVSNSYSEGGVTGTGDNIGGLVGYGASIDSSNHTGGDVSGSRYVGGLAGQTTSSVKNSYSAGNVTGTGNYIGGLVGYGTSIGSSNHTNGDVSGSSYVGGLAGQATSSVSNSYSEGNVTGMGDYIGGLVGYGTSIASSNHTNGYVRGSSYVGGLAGQTATSVSNSYSEGDVTGTSNYIGGLIGLARRAVNTTGASKADTTYIRDSYSMGNVKGAQYVGGIVGADSIFKLLTDKKNNNSSYSKPIVRIISHNSSKGSIEGKLFVGGLVGSQAVGSDSSNKYVSDQYRSFKVLSCNHSDGGVSADSNYIGGLIGYARGTVDSSSHVGGDVSGSGYVGGLVGSASVSVKNSHSEGSVTGTRNYVGGLVGSGSSVGSSSHAGGNINGASYVGGLIGYANSPIDSSNHTGGNVSGSSYVGGLAGYVGSSVSNSYSEGDVTGSGSYVGGLAGYVGAISNSNSEGNVVGSLDYVGGTAGSVTGKIRNSYAVAKYVKGRNLVGGLAGNVADSIDVSYFEGDSVTGIYQIGGLVGYAKKTVDSSYSTALVKGDDNIGGLVGSAYGDVSNSYAIGDVVGDVDHSSAGNDNLGGLVGYQYSGSVSKSMALGYVSGTTKLGGLVGRFDGTKISQSYANGNVTGRYEGDPADENGNFYIGGLVGYAKGALEETYASGIVKGIEDEPVYTGCMVGYVNGSLSVTKSYYDKSKCDLGIDGGEEAVTLTGIPDKTTAEMQTQSTFEDWDFTDTWKIMENTYPFLQIYSNSLTNAVVTTQSLEGISYDGTAKTPLVTSVTLFGETLEYETEYTITYANNVNAGTASINVCGVMPYGGCKIVNFEIAGVAVEPTIAAIDNMTYTGRALTPDIEVYNGETLLTATDYSVEYKDNINVGTATVTITMKGNYSGSASTTFEIEKATPVVSRNPTAGDVVLGQTLASSELAGGQANVDGEFVWKTPSTKPALENEGYAVIFVPMDTDNYTNSAEIVIPVKVLDMVYVAVHSGSTTIDSALVVKGSTYTLPTAPNVVGSDFLGFYSGETLMGKAGDEIAINENTVIDAVYKVQTFVITFMNGSKVLQSGEVPYGTIPTAPTVTLPKNTAQYTYSFAGWDKEVVAVTEVATYNAIIDSTINTYEVVFKDFDGEILKNSTYPYGTQASAVEKPIDPARIATAQFTYTFAGWNPSIVGVTGDAVYTAQYDSTVNVYEVVFVVPNDTLQSVKMNLAYGSVPAYEGTPTKEATAQYSYTFKGWSPEIESVSSAATYTAVFDSTIRAYTITFVNGTTTLQSNDVAYGAMPEYTGTTPTKNATVQYTYSFKSWNPIIGKVSGETTYTAVFDSVVNKYLITFKNGSEVVQSDSVAYGTIPERPEITLPKNTAQYTYSLSWDKDVVAVIGDETYTATVDSTVNVYNIVFKDYNGAVLKDSIYAYGTTSTKIVKPANPTRTTTAQYTYTFKYWSPSISDVTAGAVYTAVYDSTVRSYTITFKNGSETIESSDVEYGVKPSYKGSSPTKAATEKYTYTFKGWNPAVVSVAGAATYTAVFDSTIRKYTVTFMKDDSEIYSSSVAYGETPIYNGNTLTKPMTDSCSYIFNGWSPELAPVHGDAIYTAQFTTIMRQYIVRFKNGKETLELQSIPHGETPKYTGETPTKKSSNSYSYEFIGWSPTIGPVTQETNFIAIFDSTKITGIQDIRLAGSNVSVNAVARHIQISAAPVGSAYAIFDMQGRVLKKGVCHSANFNIPFPHPGKYLVRVGSEIKSIQIK